MDACMLCGNEKNVATVFSESSSILSRYSFFESQNDFSDKGLSSNIRYCKKCSWAWNSDAKVVDYESLPVIEDAGYSQKFLEFQSNSAKRLNKLLGSDLTLLEIGAGAGEFLQRISAVSKTAFEPSRESRRIVEKDIHVVNDFFDPQIHSCEYDLIIMRQVLEHIPSPLDFLRRLCSRPLNLDNKPFYIYVEVPNSELSFSQGRFYHFYFEHCNHFTIHSMFMIAVALNLKVEFCCSAYNDTIIQCLLSGNKSNDISKSISERRLEIQEFLTKVVIEKEQIFIWGSAGNGCFLINHFNLDLDMCPIVIDSDPQKQNLFLGKFGQMVISPERAFKEFQIKYILICSQIHSREIIEQLKINGDFEVFVV